MVECIRHPSGCGGRNLGEPCCCASVLACFAQRQARIHAHALLPAHRLRVQFVYRNRILPLFRRNKFRRLGGCHFRFASALALAGAARGCGRGFVLHRCGGYWYRTGALRRNPTKPAGALAEVDHRAVFLRHSACERGRTAESAWNATTLAIGTASDGWWSEWAALVAVLHSARNRAEAVAGATCPKLRVDRCRCCFGSRLYRRSGARDNASSLAAEQWSSHWGKYFEKPKAGHPALRQLRAIHSIP